MATTEQGRAVYRRSLAPPVDPHAPLGERLAHILGPALPWVETCACLPSVPAGLADALRRQFHPDIPATAIGRFHALTDKPADTAGLELGEEVSAALFARFAASRSPESQAEVFDFLRAQINAAVQALPERSLARQSGEALLMRLRVLEGQVLEVEVVDQLLQGHVGPALRLGLGEDARLLTDADRLSDEQAQQLEERGLLSKPRAPYAPDMVRIPAGTFWMGDLTEEGYEDERPRHEVQVSPFYMAKYPVTWQLWQKVYAWAVKNEYQFDNRGAGRGDDHPVTNINWYDAVKWCNARSEMEKRRPAYYTDADKKEPYREGQKDLPADAVDWTAGGYRLPTEAEWEKAARGGLDGHHYPWKSEGKAYERFISPENANYDERKAAPHRSMRTSRTRTVCTTWRETCGIGFGTAGQITARTLRRPLIRVARRAACSACPAAAAGGVLPGSCGARFGTTGTRRSRSSAWASVLPEVRLMHRRRSSTKAGSRGRGTRPRAYRRRRAERRDTRGVLEKVKDLFRRRRK